MQLALLISPYHLSQSSALFQKTLFLKILELFGIEPSFFRFYILRLNICQSSRLQPNNRKNPPILETKKRQVIDDATSAELVSSEIRARMSLARNGSDLFCELFKYSVSRSKKASLNSEIIGK